MDFMSIRLVVSTPEPALRVGDQVRPPRTQSLKRAQAHYVYCTRTQLFIDTQGVKRLKTPSRSSGMVACRGTGL
jgi:hypothetical protein